MLGGEWFQEIFGSSGEVSEEAVGKVALEELQAHLGITKDPLDMLVKIQKVCFHISIAVVRIYYYYI